MICTIHMHNGLVTVDHVDPPKVKENKIHQFICAIFKWQICFVLALSRTKQQQKLSKSMETLLFQNCNKFSSVVNFTNRKNDSINGKK